MPRLQSIENTFKQGGPNGKNYSPRETYQIHVSMPNIAKVAAYFQLSFMPMPFRLRPQAGSITSLEPSGGPHDRPRTLCWFRVLWKARRNYRVDLCRRMEGNISSSLAQRVGGRR